MRIQTILNRAEKFKSFVYGRARLEDQSGITALVVQGRPRKDASRIARAVVAGVVYTIACRNAGSSSCRSGGS